jgi:hypothetical protein
MPDIFDTLDVSSPQGGDVFDQVAAKSDIFDTLSPQEDALTRLEDNPFGLLLHPVQTLTGKSAFQHALDSKPEEMGISNTAPFDRNVHRAGTAAENRALMGGIADVASAPINYLPLPIGKALGAGVTALAERNIPFLTPAAEGIANWTARHLPNLAPNVARGVQDRNILTQMAAKRPVPPVDQAGAYEAWLQRNAQVPVETDPFANVPLHPAEDARAAIAQTPLELSGERGQLGFPELLDVQPVVKSRLRENAYENPIGPARDPGQQEFDFAQMTERKQRVPAEVPPQFTNPNDPVMLNFLAENFDPKSIASMSPEDRLAMGNMTPSQLRDMAGVNTAKQAPVEPPNIIQESAAATPPPVQPPQGPVSPFTPGAGGQMFMKDQGKNVREFPNMTRPPAPEPPPAPIRDQGQQQFDFTQGPAESPLAPFVPKPKGGLTPLAKRKMELYDKQDAGTLTPQEQAELNIIEESALPRGKIYKGDENLIQASARPKKIDIDEETPSIFDEPNPYPDEPVVDAPLQGIKPATDEAKVRLGNIQDRKMRGVLKQYVQLQKAADQAGDVAKVERLQGKIDEIHSILQEPKTGPSPLEDLMTILKSIEPEGGRNMVNPLFPVPRMKLSDEGKAALDRMLTVHKDELMKHAKETGGDITSYVKSLKLDPAQEKALIDRLSRVSIANFNLKQYPEEQQKQIQALFKGKEDTLKTKPMTQAQMVAKAKDISSFPITEATLRSEEGQGAAELLRRKMSEISKLTAIAEDPNLSSQDIIQNILRMNLQDTKKIATEAGRTLGAGNIPLKAHEESVAAMRKLVDRLRADPKLSSASSRTLINELRKIHPDLNENVTGAQIFKFLFRNFLTSGPLTLAANASSGVGAIAARPIMRTLEVSSAKIRSLLGGKPTTATYKEIGAMLKGMQEALKGAQLPENLKSTTFSDKYQSSPLATLAATAKTKFGQKALDVTDAVVGYPERGMRATDDFIKNTLGMMEKYASQARGEDILHDQHVIERITSSQARLTFQDEMSMIGQSVSRFRSSFSKGDPTARRQAFDIATYSLQPFIQTVDRIIMGGFNLSGLGTAKNVAKMALGRYKGAITKGIKADESMGELLDRDVAAAMIGAPMFVWSGMQLAKGNITASAPEDTAGREAFATSGKTDYSIKMGGRWIPTRLLPEPFATALQINLATHQALAEVKATGDKVADSATAAWKVATKVGYMLGTKQYLSGMNSLISTMSSKGADSVNELPVAKKLLGASVPSVVKDVGVVKDTLQNKPRVMADTALETVKRRAGMTDGMVPELNSFGEPVLHQDMGRVKTGPVYDLLQKFPPQPVERTRSGVKLSQQEYHDMKKNVGAQRKRVYETLSSNKFFMNAPKGVQQTVIEDMVNQADEIGTTPQRIKEIQKDPLYYDRALRVLLEIDKPGGERHFPFLKK